MTPEKVEIAIKDLQDLLDRLIATNMETARSTTELRARILTITGDISEQWAILQKLRVEIEATLGSEEQRKSPQPNPK